MAQQIEFIDISELTKKSALAGTEKIPVSDTQYITPTQIRATPLASSQPVGGMLPNVLYDLGALTGAVTFAFAAPSDNTIRNEYMFTFDSDSTAPTVTFPASITSWLGNCLDSNGEPEIVASKHYEVSVLGGIGYIAEV